MRHPPRATVRKGRSPAGASRRPGVRRPSVPAPDPRRGSGRSPAGTGRRRHSPSGTWSGSGGRPGITASGSSRSVPRSTVVASSARVYGCWAGLPVGRSSTTRPAYITSIRSHVWETTAMSWLMSRIAAPSASRVRASRRSTWRCTVTSSAVVGSSAMTSFGCPIRPMPIIARCRMPPENSCGYCRARRAAAGTRTAVSRSIARANAARRDRPWCCSDTSASCRPTRRAGLNDVIGSWNTMASDVPSSRSEAAASGVPANSSRSAVTTPGASIRRDTASAVRLLPEPDSPTTPIASPGRTLKLTPRTGTVHPFGPGNATRRFSTTSTASAGAVRPRRPRATPAAAPPNAGSTAGPDPDHGGHRLPHQVEREPGQHHRRAGPERGHRVDVDAVQALAQQPAPVVVRGLHADPEERQPGEGEQRRAGPDGRVHDQGLADVGQHVPGQQPDPADAGNPGRGDEVASAHRRGQRLHQPGERRRHRERDRQHRALRARRRR